MTPHEQEIAINELEERVDRLRNLYEQYFLGFERLEPMVPKKDVERRFAMLRKEQIRNTAMRFRFNVVTQKYNTYSIHWVRICRQIEDGTYKRHIRRAKARFGDAAAGPERDISIDIDIGDFDMDMDEVLAQAEASVSDRTLSEQTKPSNHAAAAVVAQIRGAKPDAVTLARAPVVSEGAPSSLVASGAVATGPVASPPSSPLSSERTPRPVMMPAGLKPRMIVRKKDDAEVGPSSARTPASGPAPPSVGRTPNAPLVVRTPNAPSVGRVAAPPPLADTPVAGVPIVRPSGGGPVARPASAAGPAAKPYTPASVPGSTAKPAPGSAPGPQIRPQIRPAPQSAGAPGAGRIPVAKPTGGLPPPSERGLPAAPPVPPGSSPKPIPSAPGSAPRPPVPPPPGSAPRLPPPSSPRLPPPSAPRVPIAPGSQPRPPPPMPSASRPKPKDEP